MGWQDRDWAKWTDEERDRFLGVVRAPAQTQLSVRSRHNEAALLAVLASLAVSVAGWQLHLFRLSVPSHSPAVAPIVPVAPIVYGTGLAHDGTSEMTCTAMATNARGVEWCTTWTILSAGQRAVQATSLPAGTTCPAVVADQSSGRWVCTAATAA